MLPSVSAVIVNYRSADLVVESLPILIDEIKKFSESNIFIVDNKSPGNDVHILMEAINKNCWENIVTLIASNSNNGFADGNNIAIREILSLNKRPEFVYLINPDARVNAGALEKMVSVLDKHPLVGIVGSRLEGLDGSPQISAFNFPTILGEFIGGLAISYAYRLLSRSWISPPQENKTYRTDWVSGASMMIRIEVLERMQGLDAGYFLYFEETDFMLNAARAGWQTWYVHEARVLHLGGQSTGVQNGQFKDGSIPLYWFDSWRRYYVKNHGRAYAILAALARLSGTILNRGHRFVRGKPFEGPRHAIRQTIAGCLWPLIEFRDPLHRLHDNENRRVQ